MQQTVFFRTHKRKINAYWKVINERISLHGIETRARNEPKVVIKDCKLLFRQMVDLRAAVMVFERTATPSCSRFLAQIVLAENVQACMPGYFQFVAKQPLIADAAKEAALKESETALIFSDFVPENLKEPVKAILRREQVGIVSELQFNKEVNAAYWEFLEENAKKAGKVLIHFPDTSLQ